jgi:hypothetical protein
LDAFGGATAAAIQGLGKAEEGAGNEIFARGYAMQELNQQAQATEASAKYTTDLGAKLGDYLSTQGKNAVDGFQPFLDGINSTREDYRNTLQSPLAQRLYDQESRSQQARLTMYAASHAGQQNKAYVLGSSKAAVDAAGDQMMAMPDDQGAAQANLASIEREANHQADIQGLDGPARQQLVATSKSTAISKQIQGMAKSQPFSAQKQLDQYSKSGDLLPEDAARMSDYVQKQRWGIGARNVASEVSAGNSNNFGSGVIDTSRLVSAIKGVESSGNYTISTPTKDGDVALGAYQIKGENLSPWLKEAGMPDMTAQQFLQNKAAQDQLARFKLEQYQTQGGSANRAAEMWFSGPNSKPGNTASDGTTNTPQYLQKFNAQLAQGASLKELTDAGRQKSQELAPDDKVFGDYVESHQENLYNQQQRIQKDGEFNNRQAVNDALSTGMQNGKFPTSLPELFSDPKAETAFHAMNSKDQIATMKALNANIGGGVQWDPSGNRLKAFNTLYGQAINEPDKFLQADIVGADLPNSAKKQLLQMQANVYHKVEADPVIGHALGVMQPALLAAGFDKKSDAESYNQFTGALQDAIGAWQKDNNKPAKDEDIQRIGSQLLQRHDAGWFSSGTPTFQLKVPDEARKIIVSNPKWAQAGVTPTEEDIQRAYARQVYIDNYMKPKAQAPSAVASPKVPVSQ